MEEVQGRPCAGQRCEMCFWSDRKTLAHQAAMSGPSLGGGGEEQSLQQGAVTQSNNLSPRGDVAPRGGMALMGDGRRLCQLVHQAACPAHV